MRPYAKVDPRAVARNWVSLALAILASVPWSVCELAGIHVAEPLVAVLGGISILGAAFLLSWAVEAAELDLPPAIAISVLALVAVLPEYAVDATFAWKAAHDPTQAGYAIANMTGGNRLLLGLGWSTLVFIAWARFGKPGIRLPDTTRVDVAVLLCASLYALVPVARGSITLVDTAVFVTMYFIYVVAAARADSAGNPADSTKGPAPEGVEDADSEESDGDHDEDLIGPAALLGALSTWLRRGTLVALLIWSAGVIFLAAEPFAMALVTTGKQMGIDEFLLVQWVAPLASEAPEFAVASLLVLRGRLAKGMLTLVSSKVNQWTLLVGTLPVVTSIAAGEPRSLPLDSRQAEEVMLTAAQSLFGVAILSNLVLSRLQAVLLAALFVGQLFVPSTEGRFIFAVFYLVIAVGVAVFQRSARNGLGLAIRGLFRALMGRPQ
jgi:cation:H+ antiporter